MTSIDSEIQKIEYELAKTYMKREEMETRLAKLQKTKQKNESKQIMEAFRKAARACMSL